MAKLPSMAAVTRAKLRRCVRVTGSLFLAVGALAGAGALHQTLAERRDARRFPPPGRMVDVGGFRLHLRLMGAGQPGPTVVLETGLDSASPVWFPLQEQVARFAPAVSYDRAGIGWSEAGPAPRDALHIARELHTLLQRAGVPEPYVLAAHSMGAFYAEVYTSLYPDEVAGLVLVDPSHPDQLDRFPPAVAREQLSWFRAIQREPLLARFGVTRLLKRGGSPPPGLPAEDAAALRALGYSVRHLQTVAAEAGAWDASAGEARAVTSLGNRPLIVLSSTEPVDAGQRSWLEMHDDLAHLSAQGVHRKVAGSEHTSLLAKPEIAAATVAAIREVVRRAAVK